MRMSKKRRTFSDKFKAKIALEAVRGVKTALHPDFRTSGLGGVCGPFY